MMRKFAGFPAGRFAMTQIPAPFFSDLLPLIDDVTELKMVLFCFWALPQKDSRFAYLREADFIAHFVQQATPTHAMSEADVQAGLRRATEREALLKIDVQGQTLYFMNTEKGRAAVAQFKAGAWQPGDLHNPVEILPERPNIYRVYEENIGALTPLIAEDLKDMERDFPADWIEEAFKLAVTGNKRNLRYIQAILRRWRADGRDAPYTPSKKSDDLTWGG